MAVYKRGNVYWYHFTFAGRRVQASTKVRNRNDALEIERCVRTDMAKGLVGLEQRPKQSPSVSELFDALERDFRTRGKWSVRQESNFRGLRAAFSGGLKASGLTAADVDRFIARKQKQGRAAGTINRVTLLLGQAYRLANLEPPKITHLSEAGNERKGFFEADEFRRVYQNLPEGLRDFALFAFITGWRKSEIASLTWADVEDNLIRLRGEHSKNREARSVAIAGQLFDLIARRREARLVGGTTLSQFVFHRSGSSVQEFRKAWASACKKAGVDRLFHDLRRSAVRNMIRSGVPQSIAMKISGHKTASMFRRYDIASEDDLRAAMQSVDRYHQAAQQKIVSIAK